MNNGGNIPKKTDRSALKKKAKVARGLLRLRPGDAVDFVVKQYEVKIAPLHSDLEENFGKVFPNKRPEDFNIIRSLTEEQIAKEKANGK
ncbi:hypothetical protein V4762_08155 [Thermodesulfobium sp. 4217-1]|uniref:AbrB/MazE/SpoVT family DNA-binding domain-containing protein n=1 Tax=Thermodesulfobium sp. 4217-1 TaxID=3120013 RepID=UPI0032217F4A